MIDTFSRTLSRISWEARFHYTPFRLTEINRNEIDDSNDVPAGYWTKIEWMISGVNVNLTSVPLSLAVGFKLANEADDSPFFWEFKKRCCKSRIYTMSRTTNMKTLLTLRVSQNSSSPITPSTTSFRCNVAISLFWFKIVFLASISSGVNAAFDCDSFAFLKPSVIPSLMISRSSADRNVNVWLDSTASASLREETIPSFNKILFDVARLTCWANNQHKVGIPHRVVYLLSTRTGHWTQHHSGWVPSKRLVFESLQSFLRVSCGGQLRSSFRKKWQSFK